MTDKSTRWSFTAYEGQYPALDEIAKSGNPLIAEIGWQDEICPDTQRKHRQGYVRTVRQVRFSQIQEQLKGVHLEKAQNWDALVNYCRKPETRDPSGTQVQAKFERPMRLHEMLVEVAMEICWFNLDAADLQETPIRIDRQTDRQTKLRLLREFSTKLVYRHPEYSVVLCRQDARDAWCDYTSVWMDLGGSKLAERSEAPGAQ